MNAKNSLCLRKTKENFSSNAIKRPPARAKPEEANNFLHNLINRNLFITLFIHSTPLLSCLVFFNALRKQLPRESESLILLFAQNPSPILLRSPNGPRQQQHSANIQFEFPIPLLALFT